MGIYRIQESTAMRVALTVVKGPEQGHIMEFKEPRESIIGRARDADFQLSPDDHYVGWWHAYPEIAPPSCRLWDLSSINCRKDPKARFQSSAKFREALQQAMGR
jgi:hypothetical protein